MLFSVLLPLSDPVAFSEKAKEDGPFEFLCGCCVFTHVALASQAAQAAQAAQRAGAAEAEAEALRVSASYRRFLVKVVMDAVACCSCCCFHALYALPQATLSLLSAPGTEQFWLPSILFRPGNVLVARPGMKARFGPAEGWPADGPTFPSPRGRAGTRGPCLSLPLALLSGPCLTLHGCLAALSGCFQGHLEDLKLRLSEAQTAAEVLKDRVKQAEARLTEKEEKVEELSGKVRGSLLLISLLPRYGCELPRPSELLSLLPPAPCSVHQHWPWWGMVWG